MSSVITVHTRTLPPTQTTEKRVRARSSEGALADYPWDHAYDAPEVHEGAARKLALLGNPHATVKVYRTGSDVMGYTFRVTIED